MIGRIIRLLIALFTAAGGFSLSISTFSYLMADRPQEVRWALVGLATVVAGVLGLSLAPFLISAVSQSTRWLEARLTKIPAPDIMGGAIGLILGLVIVNLLGASFYRLPIIGPYLPIAGSLLLGYVGWNVGTTKKDEIQALFHFFRGSKDRQGKQENRGNFKILDTSVIIDGRIADIFKSGFVEGTLAIPSFVLEELRHIADSADVLKRNRGRRGLDILNRIRKEHDLAVHILETDYEDLNEVDSKLVRLAKDLSSMILTNDYNLNKVAELQGVRVLNINELANAVKPVVLPGEELQVQLIKDGKESGQGVGYMDDGTMIVVENGRRFIGHLITVQVTSVLQTSAGRMIFGRSKQGERRQDINQPQALERGEYQWIT